MSSFQIAGIAVVLAGLVGGAVVTAPVAHGQVARGSGDREERILQRLLSLRSGTSEIGATVRDVDEADVTREKLPAPEGAVIDEVRSDSPAADAGLRAGDVVVEFDRERVRSARQLTRLVQETPPGRAVSVAVIREGQRAGMEITPDAASRRRRVFVDADRPLLALERFGRNFSFTLPDIDVDIWSRSGQLGVSVQALSPQLAEYFGVTEGVLVTSVSAGSPAEAAGLKAGDVITSMDDWSIDDVRELRRRLSRIEPGEEFTVLIVRDKEEMAVTAALNERWEEPSRRGNRPPA